MPTDPTLDLFHCEKYRCQLSKRACVARQRKMGNRYMAGAAGGKHLPTYEYCSSECQQGVEVALSIGETPITIRPPRKPHITARLDCLICGKTQTASPDRICNVCNAPARARAYRAAHKRETP